nr:hypothetical protein CFP56_71604 [Quercus suber]
MSFPTVRVTCLCGRHQGRTPVASALPVRNTTCSCDTCRYTSGVLFTSHLPLIGKPEFADGLTRYATATTGRYFCSECGSQMLCYSKGRGHWGLCAGVVEGVEGHGGGQALQEFAAHHYLADTGDGGIIAGLAGLPDSTATFCLQDRTGPTFSGPSYLEYLTGSRSLSLRSKQPLLSSDRLEGSCHCGGVQYCITRPGPESRQPSSPWPDLILPSHSNSPDNPDDIKWWLRERCRYLAGICMCRSCRLSSGASVQTWAFIPRNNLMALDGSPIEFSQGTLSSYESSRDVYRNFCRVCSASVFWHCAERPNVIDVSVGLFRAPEGARSSTWLEWWTERVSYKEEALDAKLGEDLEKSLSCCEST